MTHGRRGGGQRVRVKMEMAQRREQRKNLINKSEASLIVTADKSWTEECIAKITHARFFLAGKLGKTELTEIYFATQ